MIQSTVSGRQRWGQQWTHRESRTEGEISTAGQWRSEGRQLWGAVEREMSTRKLGLLHLPASWTETTGRSGRAAWLLSP